ncbi:MAG: MFS transporter [Dermatophilaceae bacterium]
MGDHTTPLTRHGIPIDPHLRVLGAIALVDTLGRGATMTTIAIYFTHVVGLPATQVAFAIGLGAFVEFALGTPLGVLSDRVEPRRLLTISLAMTAVIAAGFLVVTDLIGLCLVSAGMAASSTTARSVRNMLVARVGGPTGQAVAFKAYLRAITNTGMAVGGLLAGLALWADTRTAYLAVFAWDAVTYLGAAVVARFLPDAPGPQPAPAPALTGDRPPARVWRDVPYVLSTALVAIFAMHFMVFEIAVPLWVAGHTEAPKWLVAAMFILNTVAVALLQVRLSRQSATVANAGPSMARAGVLVGLGFVCIAAAATAGPLVASVVLLAGAAIHVFGELIGSGAQWAVNMGLAPMERQGEYQGFAGSIWSLSAVVSPTLATWLCIEHGYAGWAAIIAIIAGAALSLGPVSRWALRTRAEYGVTTHTG